MRYALLLVAACSTSQYVRPDAIECATASQYRGATVTCTTNTGAPGVCIAGQSVGITCFAKCSDVSPVCADGEFWYTLQVSDGPPVCYCVPH